MVVAPGSSVTRKVGQAVATVLLFTWMIVAGATSIVAQNIPQGCRQDLLAIADSSIRYRYAIRANGSYCDGNVPVQNRGEVRFLSYTLDRISFPAPRTNLLIHRPPGFNGTLFVRGEDKRSGRSYRMDGVIGSAGLVIDLDAAARPSDVGADNLGLLAWDQTAGGNEHWPAVAGADPNSAPTTILAVRTPVPIIRLARTTCNLDTDACGPQEIIGTQLAEGTVTEIVFQRTRERQRLRVKIAALAPGNAVYADEVRIIVPPLP